LKYYDNTGKLISQNQKENPKMGLEKYTAKQGQYLAFIYYYTKLNGIPPAESDMQRYFQVSPPSVHQMVLTLEKKNLISRISEQGRSIQIMLQREELPDLE
jgi:repressor LexA